MVKKILLSDKIFLAGATGMAGSAILRTLYENNYGQKDHNGEILFPSRKELNLLNNKDVFDWFKKNRPTVVILAAAKVGGILANATKSADFLLENIKIQTNVIEAAWHFNIKRFLFLGSSCIYPKYANQPIKEEYLLNGSLEETNECYAISKIAGIKLCQSLRNQYGFDAISLMPTNLYGTNDNYTNNQSHVMAGLIRRFCEAKKNNLQSVVCWGTGNPMREFLHVDDMGNAALFALENWDPTALNAPVDSSGKPLTFLNVGTGLEISISNLAMKIAKEAEYNGEILWDTKKPDGTPKKRLSIDKIKELGWTPKIKLDEGIKKTVEEFKRNNNL